MKARRRFAARGLCTLALTFWGTGTVRAQNSELALPSPLLRGEVSLEQSLANRRSHRRFSSEDLTRSELSQLLWAAQGITSDKGFRTAPSAGARYPLTVFVLRSSGTYRYQPRGHKLIVVHKRDLRAALWKDVYARPWLSDAPAMFVIAANYAVTRAKYGAKADRFVHIEVGHVGQNLLLQATALGLHCVGVGAFHDKRVPRTLGLASNVVPLYIVVAGRPPSGH